MIDLFLEAHERAPSEIVLDLDTTDDPVHEEQEGRFFHGYYDCYCYLPLYVFCGRHLLAAKLRRASMDARWQPMAFESALSMTGWPIFACSTSSRSGC